MVISDGEKSNSNIMGFVDYCDHQRVSGWLIDFSDINRHLSLKIFIDDSEVCSGLADEYRQDLAANPSFNGTCHAYNLNISNHLADGKEHEIKVVETETGYVLKNSSSNVRFPKLTNLPKEPRLDLALVGKDGWLFLCNDSNDAIGQYTGKVKLTNETLEQYKKHYQTIQNFYKSKKIHYLLTIVPGKESIYSEFLPDGVIASSDITVKDQFISVVNPELDEPILDLKPVLLANKNEGQLYYKNDSHWNYLGAMIACETIINKLRDDFSNIPEFNKSIFHLIESDEGQCDLNGKTRLNYKNGSYGEENVEFVEKSPAICAVGVQCDKAAIEITEHPYLHLSKTRPTRLFKHKNRTNLPRAIIVRDSYADWMIPFLSEFFSECLFIWSRSVDYAVVESFNPDVIIEQVVDRFLVQNRVVQSQQNRRLLGTVEIFDLDLLSGWAYYEDDISETVTLEILLNNNVVGTIHADTFRNDLNQPNKKIGFNANFNIQKYNLLQYLPSSCRITVRDFLTKQVIANGQKDFVVGQNNFNHEFSDKCGRQFKLVKGIFWIPLSEYSKKEITSLLSSLDELIDITKTFGNDLIICYGTLLGAARQGNILEHDDDIDCAFIAKSTDMLSAAKEFLGYANFLQSKQYDIKIQTNGQIHISKYNQVMPIDVFLAWFTDDKLSLTFTVKDALYYDQVYPLTMIRLGEKEYPTVLRYDLLLEKIYGSKWLIPDPAFTWHIPKDISDYFLPLHNYNLHANHDYWANYYKVQKSNSPPSFPSQFAIFVLSQCENFSSIIDIGCGNGRDSFFMGKLGLNVIGADYEEGVIERNNLIATNEKLHPKVSFKAVDFSDLNSVYQFVTYVTENMQGFEYRCFYSRFFFHAVDLNTQASVFEFLKSTMKNGDVFACEFRTESDENRVKITELHYRRYIKKQDFINHAAKYSLSCYYSLEGQGYANYQKDDAQVARLLFKKQAKEI